MPDGPAPLAALYREIDRRAAHLRALHADRLQCRRGCSDCCVDELTVFELEAENIRAQVCGEERPRDYLPVIKQLRMFKPFPRKVKNYPEA